MLYQRRRHVREQLAAQQALKQTNEVLEQKVQQRTADLQNANLALQQEVVERMHAETTLRAAQDEPGAGWQTGRHRSALHRSGP